MRPLGKRVAVERWPDGSNPSLSVLLRSHIFMCELRRNCTKVLIKTMNINEAWEKALQSTEIHRNRVKDLATFSETRVEYILLSESTINLGDTLVRKGEVTVLKPSIVLPPNIPQFLGFEFEKESDFQREAVTNFLLVRGIQLPSLKYNNKTLSLNIYEGAITRAIGFFKDDLQRREDVHIGLVSGPDDCWQFSLLIFLCTQVARNAEADIRRLLEDFKRRKKE